MAFEPTAQQRGLVETMSACGLRPHEMRLMIVDPSTGRPIDYATFTRTFRDEIDRGPARINLAVWLNVLRIARNQDNSPTTLNAAMWWLKNRAGATLLSEAERGHASEPVIESATATLKSKLDRYASAGSTNVVHLKSDA